MQKINVTDIKVKTGVTETGARAGQKWELIIIIGEDGSEFTTFDTKAKEVGIGGVIELEPVIKAGKTNFTKFNIIKKGEAVSATAPNGESPEKRHSIEDQTRAQLITELWIHSNLRPNDILIEKLRTYLEKLGSSEPGQQATTPAKGKAPLVTPKEGEKWPPLKNRGELLTRAQRYGISSRDVCETVEVGKPEDIIDYDEAWTATAKRFASTIKASEVTK